MDIYISKKTGHMYRGFVHEDDVYFNVLGMDMKIDRKEIAGVFCQMQPWFKGVVYDDELKQATRIFRIAATETFLLTRENEIAFEMAEDFIYSVKLVSEEETPAITSVKPDADIDIADMWIEIYKLYEGKK